MEKVANPDGTKKLSGFLAFFDDESKGRVKWWSRNWFYLGTALVVIINIVVFTCVKKRPWEIVEVADGGKWHEVFYFNTTLCGFLTSFFHANWQHVLLNMLCFFVAGIYLERKKGTIGLILFVLFAAYVSAIAIAANDLSVFSVGYSGVNYFIYATIISDYAFSFQKYRRNKINIILGGIVVALIYLAMCFNGGTSTISFSIFPYDFMHNMAHYTSFLAGAIVGIFTEIIKFTSRASLLSKQDKSEPGSSTLL